MKSPVISRTIYIDGRKTGVSLEDAFWSLLEEIARAEIQPCRRWLRDRQDANTATCPPRFRLFYSTGSAQKKWEPPRGNGSPNSAASFGGWRGC